jgi:hypothetical protein
MEWARSAKFIHIGLLALAESFISCLIEFKRGEIATELREILVVERIHHLWSTVGDFQY